MLVRTIVSKKVVAAVPQKVMGRVMYNPVTIHRIHVATVSLEDRQGYSKVGILCDYKHYNQYCITKVGTTV